jgi:hypothetical protein
MASPNAVFTEMVTTTLRNHPSAIADNVSKNNALYSRLKSRGKVKLLDGGYEIVRNLDYAENSTFQRYSGYDTLNIQASDVLSAAKYPWVQSAIHITASGYELRTNAGKSQMVDLVEARVSNAMKTAANYMALDIYSDGALANQMGGLASIIQTAGTGTVGGIDSSVFTFWQNKAREAAGTNTISATTIKGEMMALYMQLRRGADKPNLIVSTHDFYQFYWDALTDLQRYSKDSGEANLGFTALQFNDCPVIYDDNANFATTGERMYFLNLDYLELVAHRQANWKQLEEKMSTNQDAVVIPVVWQGQMVCSNRALQGILVDAA